MVRGALMRPAGYAALGAACALFPALGMWGFTVDDALISVRYAENVASGAGFRFDAAGPVTDGVTPLPWVPLLALVARGDPLDVLVRAKVAGVVAWTAAGAVLGAALARRARGVVAAAALVIVALAFEIGAWAASGMETGVVTALATLAAVSFGRPRTAAALAGLAAAFRPELLPWALVVAAGAGGARAAAVAAAPFAGCVIARLAAFGHAAPLAVAAKPSDPSHGVLYAAASVVVVLTPLAALAPLTVLRGSRMARALSLACVVHVLAIAAAGGDWMPYARLMVPVAPSLALVFAEAAASCPRLAAVRAALAVALGAILLVRAAPAGRGVDGDRRALVRAARPVLADARVVAALDVGWVSAAVPKGARIVDLAGLTDPVIAALPGGHTSKRVDAAMLVDRGVDTVVVYSDPRVVEARLLRSPLFAARFERRGSVPLGDRGARYDVYAQR